jgi:N utilization substance protein B
MDRTGARTAAMMLVYEWEMGGDGGEDTREGMLELQPDEKEFKYMEMLFNGVLDNKSAIDAAIAKYLVGWRLERISRVDLSIMRVAAYEIMYTQLPKGVAVNEALEMARIYSEPKAVGFINGVLGSLVRGLK